jgi:hypothetical protein
MGIIYKTLFLILIIYFTAARNKIWWPTFNF